MLTTLVLVAAHLATLGAPAVNYEIQKIQSDQNVVYLAVAGDNSVVQDGNVVLARFGADADATQVPLPRLRCDNCLYTLKELPDGSLLVHTGQHFLPLGYAWPLSFSVAIAKEDGGVRSQHFRGFSLRVHDGRIFVPEREVLEVYDLNFTNIASVTHSSMHNERDMGIDAQNTELFLAQKFDFDEVWKMDFRITPLKYNWVTGEGTFPHKSLWQSFRLGTIGLSKDYPFKIDLTAYPQPSTTDGSLLFFGSPEEPDSASISADTALMRLSDSGRLLKVGKTDRIVIPWGAFGVWSAPDEKTGLVGFFNSKRIQKEGYELRLHDYATLEHVQTFSVERTNRIFSISFTEPEGITITRRDGVYRVLPAQ